MTTALTVMAYGPLELPCLVQEALAWAVPQAWSDDTFAWLIDLSIAVLIACPAWWSPS